MKAIPTARGVEAAGDRPGRKRRRPRPRGPRSYDSWLEHFQGPALNEIDDRLSEPVDDGYQLFGPLDDDLWAVLLFRQYSLYPNIRRFLPDLPSPELQRQWNYSAGMRLARTSNAFYRKVKGLFAEHGPSPLAEARVLDFGCGWGRMTRFFARDTAEGNLYGCDVAEESLEICAALGIPARIERSHPVPRELPFETRFDLVFAHSVFTHQSERAHEACLQAIHDALAPGGLAVLTVRPPSYMDQPPMARLRRQLEKGPGLELDQPRYYFSPGSRTLARMQSVSRDQTDELTFGNTFITNSYIRERWGRVMEVVDIGFQLESMTQVVVTLRRRAE